MKKEVKEIKEMRTVYIAEDGKEFFSEWECVQYEKSLARKSYIEQVKKLEVKELRYVCPISPATVNPDNNLFWYKVETLDDFIVLCKAYETSFIEPEKYPELICIEDAGFEPFSYEGSAYEYTLSDIMRDSKEFFGKLGYEFILKKESNKKSYLEEKEEIAVNNELLWDTLKEHLGHNVEIVSYGDPNEPDNIALECEDCGAVILDAEIYTLAAREDV